MALPAATLLFFSVDETSQLHDMLTEPVRSMLDTGGVAPSLGAAPTPALNPPAPNA